MLQLVGDTTCWCQAPPGFRSPVVEVLCDVFENLVGVPLEMSHIDNLELLGRLIAPDATARDIPDPRFAF